MEPWQEYQYRAAELLRELGFETEVDADLPEANGTLHAIDVAARRTVAGVDQLWIVECKFWNKPVDMGAVRDLRTLVLDLGASHGLLMSESGFQSGAISTVKGKNITLTSLEDLRFNASQDLLAARVAVVEERMRNLRQKLLIDLRTPYAAMPGTLLTTMASGLSVDDWAELSARTEAPDFFEGILEIARRTGAEGIGDYASTRTDLSASAPIWRDGVDPAVMDGLSSEMNEMTQALDLGKLGNWPVVCRAADGSKVAQSMPQLLGAIESRLTVLEQQVAREAGNAT